MLSLRMKMKELSLLSAPNHSIAAEQKNPGFLSKNKPLHLRHTLFVFTARRTPCKARYCRRKLSVRLSVCLSVTLMYSGYTTQVAVLESYYTNA